jgi:hypothetical protein
MNARGLIYFKTLIYWSTRATGPTILATVGITVRRVTRTLLAAFLRFLKLFLELSHFFGQMAYLIGIPTAWFLPGLLCRVEGFNLTNKNLLTAVLVEPTTLVGVVSRERPVNSLAPFAILGSTALFGGSLAGPSPMLTLPLPGYVINSLRGCSYLGLVGSGCFICPFCEHFLEILEVQ